MNTEPASQAVVDRIAELARQADSFELIRLAKALAILRGGGGRGGPPRGPWRQGIGWAAGGPGGPPPGPPPGPAEPPPREP